MGDGSLRLVAIKLAKSTQLVFSNVYSAIARKESDIHVYVSIYSISLIAILYF